MVTRNGDNFIKLSKFDRKFVLFALGKPMDLSKGVARSANSLLFDKLLELGFPLSEARGKDGPFIPCYASLPLEFPKAGVTRRIRLLCAALCAACTRAWRCVVSAPVYPGTVWS